MSTSRTPPVHVALASELPQQWGWLLILGIGLLLAGIAALLDSVLATAVSVMMFGWILVIAGIIEAIQAFRHRGHNQLLLYVLNAILSLVVGAMLLRHPAGGALILTLLLAAYFVVGGVFRIVTAISLHTPGWGWALFDGIVTLILGALIWANWPLSGLWVIGLFIGIDLIVVGWSQIMIAFALRAIRVEP